MKILWLNSLFPSSFAPHAGIFNVSCIQALQRLGVKVQVICPVGLTPPERFLWRFPPDLKQAFNYVKSRWVVERRDIIKDIKVEYVKWAWLPRKWFWEYEGSLLYLIAHREMERIIKVFKPDLIHASWLNPEGVIAGILSQKYQIPAVIHIVGSDVNWYLAHCHHREKINKLIKEKTNGLIFVSAALQKQAHKLGLHHQNEWVIHYGVDKERFTSVKSHRSKAKKMILAVGNLEWVKGQDVLLNAFARLREQRADVELTFVGDGSLRGSLQRTTEKLGLDSIVRFVGFVSNEYLPDFYQQCDIVCVPSRSEGLPCVSLEAMACGKPVVASKVGGIPEIVKEGISGFLAPPVDPDSLAQALNSALEEKWNTDVIRAYAEKRTWQKVGQEIFAVYKNILK